MQLARLDIYKINKDKISTYNINKLKLKFIVNKLVIHGGTTKSARFARLTTKKIHHVHIETTSFWTRSAISYNFDNVLTTMTLGYQASLRNSGDNEHAVDVKWHSWAC